LKIRSLTLHGFKSFADATRIDFHEGITAIVGPNGCGKSNISDALRWVLGEQRPTAIRGARMEEAIFGGTEARRAIHRAEVTLVLDNEDRALAVPYSEVVIGRTVHRGGEGEYTLNGSPCRLRDILDLCRDTGLGANEYSIIEGRMIDSILSDRAEERRSLLEEAAGIGRYKDRRRTALRRLDQADADLTRLDDLLSEVRSQVRSLARQRGRAERHAEMRDRRLSLEIAVADARLLDLETRLGHVETELQREREMGPGQESELQTHETATEALRLKIVQVGRERSETAAAVERVRTRLEELERGRLVAAERASAAAARLEMVRAEISALAERLLQAQRGREEVEKDLGAREEELARLRAELVERTAEVAALKTARDERRGEEEAELSEMSAVIRRLSVLEAERETLDGRTRDREAELSRRRGEIERAAAVKAKLEEEVCGAEQEATLSLAEVQARRAATEEARVAMERGREAVRAARERLGGLEGQLAAEQTREAGIRDLLSAGKDLPPTVAALLQERGSISGVLGVLADCVEAPRELAGAVEAHLGRTLYGVVVQDWKTVAAVRGWLKQREGDDGVLLLPLEPGPTERSAAAPAGAGTKLLDRVKVRGPGAPWVRALLDGVTVRSGAEFAPASEAWVLPDGCGQDRRGAVFLGRPTGGAGAVERRSELDEIGRLVRRLAKQRERLRAELEELEAALRGHMQQADSREAELREAERTVSEVLTRKAAAEEHLARVSRELEEIQARIERLEAGAREAHAHSQGDEGRLEALKLERKNAEEGLSRMRASALAAAAAWESASAALGDLQIRVARSEADQSALEERRTLALRTCADLEEQHTRLIGELAALETTIADGRQVAAESQQEVAEHFDSRAELQTRLTGLESEIQEWGVRLREDEAHLRAARQAARDRSERRHALELEEAELRGQRSTLRERLEAEWEVPYEELRERAAPPGEGSVAEWARELEDLRERMARMGPINLLASREYETERERFDFLEGQRKDLVTARDDLRASIQHVNETAAEAFGSVFHQVRENFHRIFGTLFEGGECDVWLESPEDMLDSPIEISASPRGKKTQRIHLLSGGERALTALALLFAIYLAKPSPFCVMDEVDAPLDESNIERFTAMLESFKEETQFLVISHNPRTIEAADWIYGVTMQEPGVSSVVGVELKDLPRDNVA